MWWWLGWVGVNKASMGDIDGLGLGPEIEVHMMAYSKCTTNPSLPAFPVTRPCGKRSLFELE